MALALSLAGAAAAEPVSRQVFAHKAWEVQIVGFDDGSIACVARVSDGSDLFSIWADATNPVKLQFYSEGWDFGEGDTATLVVQIDRRAPWTLTNAELYLQSVLFNLPEGDASTRFLREVVGGGTLRLNSESGSRVQSYTLAGSSASIRALGDCVDVLTADSNPFD